MSHPTERSPKCACLAMIMPTGIIRVLSIGYELQSSHKHGKDLATHYSYC
jgi:hypothetical protein